MTDTGVNKIMKKHGKKYNKMAEQVQKRTIMPIKDALEKIKECAYTKFDESVDVDINLTIDPTKGEQVVRGSVVLPHGRGKVVKILVFAKGDLAQQAVTRTLYLLILYYFVKAVTRFWHWVGRARGFRRCRAHRDRLPCFTAAHTGHIMCTRYAW